ncbi:hypothetical protein [Streptomyces sp. NPDC048192]|uniref:hypothetical protein n=1 Tax=Streptomyces sp. NPDC048192 TaxID=3365510 RepID=UPI003723D05D
MAENPMWNRPGAVPPAGAPATSQQPVPPPPDTAPAAVMVGKRTVAEVAAIVDNMEYAVRAKGYELEEWHQGILAAYTWVLGVAATAPLTGRTSHGIPDAAQLRAEDDAAEEALRSGPRRKYANGVQHAVMWVRGLTDDQPWLMWQKD